jgi:cyclin C
MNVYGDRGLVNDTYKMDLMLVHPPHQIALACIYIASVLREKDTTVWYEELRVDMNVVSILFRFIYIYIYIYI